jgi:hypothetical protein
LFLIGGQDLKKINHSETRIACGGHVCYLIGTKISILDRGLSIDASYHASVHLAMRFQRRRFFIFVIAEGMAL